MAKGEAQGADEAGGGPQEAARAPRGRRPLMLGAGLMAACAAGAFGAVWAGVVPSLGAATAKVGTTGAAGASATAAPAPVAYVPLEPITVTLGEGGARRHLRFTAQLEVPATHAAAVSAALPRAVDVLGGYLRALEPAMIEGRDAQLRLRAQMLRRAQLVLGADAVQDLLVMELVVN